MRFEAEYANEGEFFLKTKLVESKSIKVNEDFSILENASLAFGEIAFQLVPFNPQKNYPIYELDYIIKENRVNWAIKPNQFSIQDYFLSEKISKRHQNTICLVEPSCRGDGGPDTYNILIALYQEINTLFLEHPFGIFLMGYAFSLMQKSAFSKVINYLDIQYVNGSSHLKLKSFLYSRESWDISDLSYKLNADLDVTEEILKLYGYELDRDKKTFILKYRIDISKK